MAPAFRGRSSAVPIHGDDHAVATAPAIPTAAGHRAQAAPHSRLAPEEKLVANLIGLLEAGTSPWRREWDGHHGGHHRNLLSGRRYSGANPALLHLAMHLRGSALPYWCGFAEAKAMGLFPRKGSRAVHVLRPQVQGRHDAPPEEGKLGKQDKGAGSSGGERSGDGLRVEEAGAAEGRRWVRYRPVPVFNAADLEGEALAGLIRKRRQAEAEQRRPEPERLAEAEAVLRAWPVPVSVGGDRACYLPEPDRIVLPERSAFHSAAALYATWAHEAIHSTGHRSRLARDLSGGMGAGGDGGRAYAREELVAELGAVLLGDRLEIGAAMANHAAYLDHWIGLLQETPRLLFQVLAEARRAADLICPEQPPAGEA
jgi:antirestriction protein ArdC